MQQLPTILPPPVLPDGTEPPPRSAKRQANLVRFQSELEFIQCLASPQYLHELSIQGYLAKPAFLNYLKYLEYWRSPEYVRFIVYSTCLVYLTLLQTDLFRARLGDPAFITELVRVGTRHHETWRVEKHPSQSSSNTAHASSSKSPIPAAVNGDDEDEEEEQGQKSVREKKKWKSKSGQGAQAIVDGQVVPAMPGSRTTGGVDGTAGTSPPGPAESSET